MDKKSHYVEVREEDSMGRVVRTRLDISDGKAKKTSRTTKETQSFRLMEYSSKLFMPAGYPATVTPDYLQFQILNALQAFCSSLASLLSSRAVLEGFGVGDASATATNALLLTVVQEFFSRVATIIGAHHLGSSLFPDAKMYRLLADILFDFAIIIDTLSPLLVSGSVRYPGLRIAMLCISGSMRAVCGICAGGARTAITVHFANPVGGNGDVGDLNAKQSSQETVLSLAGMLLGTLIVPLLTTPFSTYSTLFALVALHLIINYYAVRGFTFRSINRQRASLLWSHYQEQSSIPSFQQVAMRENVFQLSRTLRHNDKAQGRCTIGSSFANAAPHAVIEHLEEEKYMVWVDPTASSQKIGPHVHIALKAGHSPEDHLKAWVHALEITRIRSAHSMANYETLIRDAYHATQERFPEFLRGLKDQHWDTSDISLLTGAPDKLVTSLVVVSGEKRHQWEHKKDQ